MFGLLKRVKFLYHASNVLSINSDKCLTNNFIQLRTLKLTANCKIIEEIDTDENTKPKRNKTVPLTKITLENDDGSMHIILLEDAIKLAKRRNLFLIQMPYIDTKGSRRVYRIVDHATYIESMHSDNQEGPDTNKEKKDNNKKSTKNYTISSKIFQNDLDTKLNNMNKLLKKGHMIRIVLTCSNQSKEKDEVVQYVKKKLKGVVESEKIKNNNIILTYSPPENKNSDENDS